MGERLLGGIIGVITNALVVGLFFVAIESFDTHEALLSHEKKEASLFFYPLHQTTGLFIKDVRAQIEHWKEMHDEATDEEADEKTEKPEENTEKPELQSFEEIV